MRVPHRAAGPLAGTRRLLVLAAAALALIAGLPVAPAMAEGGAIHFGRTAGEDRLIGGAPGPGDGFRSGTRSGPHSGIETHDGPWHRSRAARAAYRHSSPSVVSYGRPPRSTYFRGTGIFANAQGAGSVLVLPSRPPERGEFEGEGGAKIIDVAANRLDHRPIGPSGLSVQYVGSAKIIRIAPGYGRRPAERDRAAVRPAQEKDMAALPAPAEPVPPTPTPAQPPAEVPAPQRAPREAPAADATEAPAPQAAAPFLEPWTDDWLRDCVARHPDFDASLGTYTGADGLRRFCTGEAG